MSKQNAWHQAIVAHLQAAGGPLPVEQIWERMKDSGFQHASKKPRSTLGARIAELVKDHKLKRVGPATYQLAQELTVRTRAVDGGLSVRKLKFALDADGVLRNFTAGALVVVEAVTGKKFTSADVTAFNFTKALGLSDDESCAVMKSISSRRGFVTSLPPYPQARQGVRRLRELGDVFCVTTPWDGPSGKNPWWCDESESWLALHFGIDVVHHADDKAGYEADVFVDDKSSHVRNWLSRWPGRTAVFWRTPHNTSEVVPYGAHSIGSWEALYEIARETALGPVQPSLPMLEVAQ